MDDQPWSHSFNNHARAAMKKSPKPKHRRSPATTVRFSPCVSDLILSILVPMTSLLFRSPQFPIGSPKVNHHQSEYGDDDASFNLFNHSFDTMSDTANYLRDLNHQESYRDSAEMIDLHRQDTSQNIDFSLPALSQYIIGDVSPVRSYNEGRSHGRTMSGMEPIPVHFPQDEETAAAVAAHAHGYYGNARYSDQAEAAATNPYGGSLVSNPFFVLRCARQAFSNCTFLFSCLSTPDPCVVNVSENGSFQHVQGSDNQAYLEVS
jgi:hypothetical protein